MAFSSRSLLNLQRLSRVVKKELQLTVSIGTREGIGELLRRAVLENHSLAIIEAQNAFVSGLSEQDRAELTLYNVPIKFELTSAVSAVKSPELNSNAEEKKNGTIVHDRRQRNVKVARDRRKKPVIYRGTVIKVEDRRKKALLFAGSERRGNGMGEGNGTIEKVETKKKKPLKMYRGQPIRDDDE